MEDLTLINVVLGNNRAECVKLFGTWFSTDEAKLGKVLKRIDTLLEVYPTYVANLQQLRSEVEMKMALQHSDEIAAYLKTLPSEKIQELLGQKTA